MVPGRSELSGPATYFRFRDLPFFFPPLECLRRWSFWSAISAAGGMPPPGAPPGAPPPPGGPPGAPPGGAPPIWLGSIAIYAYLRGFPNFWLPEWVAGLWSLTFDPADFGPICLNVVAWLSGSEEKVPPTRSWISSGVPRTCFLGTVCAKPSPVACFMRDAVSFSLFGIEYLLGDGSAAGCGLRRRRDLGRAQGTVEARRPRI